MSPDFNNYRCLFGDTEYASHIPDKNDLIFDDGLRKFRITGHFHELSRKEAENVLRNQFLVELLSLFDVLAGRKMPYSPVLIRVEEFDLLIIEKDRQLRFWIGDCETERNLPDADPQGQSVFRWKRIDCQSFFLGDNVKHVILANANEELVIQTDESRIVIREGGVLKVTELFEETSI